MTEVELKRELTSLLQTDNVDYDKVIALTNQLAQYDTKHARFSIDAGIVNRLGRELVTKAETAISELIKNAYDAEATYVNLVFQKALVPNGSLLIEDDGCGMTRDELINGFMRLSSSEKLHNPISPIFKRKKAGKKGIGRFATQRLGDTLTVITQTQSSTEAIKATIQWNDYTTDTNLNEISFDMEFVPKQREKGTTLIIDHLVEAWSDAMLKKIYRNTSNIILPEPLSEERKNWDSQRMDPGFKAYFYRDVISPTTIIVDEDKAFYDYALAIIEGHVNKEGHGFWKSSSTKIEIPHTGDISIGKDRNNDNEPFQYIHDIYFKTYYFIYENSLIPKNSFTYIKGLGNTIGGIKLYRNGFRVPPYGESGNDWLKLDESVRKRTYIFPHQNQSFFGYVELDDKAALLLEETSSREGVIENEAYQELIDFVYRSIITACQEIAAIRDKKQTANQKNWQKKSPDDKAKDALNSLQEMVNEQNEQKGNGNNQGIQDNLNILSDYIKEQQDETRRLIDENNMLRIFAGLGLVIGEFIHEIKNYIPGFQSEISYLNNLLQHNKEALERIHRLELNMASFTSYTSYFDKAISRNAHREIESINIKERIQTFCNIIMDNANKANIRIHNNLDKEEVLLTQLETIPMHPSEWASILFNLYTNSKKAIKKARRKNGEIYISCGKVNNYIFIEFSDNGTGIDPRIKDTMYDAFITTTSAASADSEDFYAYSGTGLGLKIIKDIVNSYGGTIKTTNPIDGIYATTFRIEIPANI